MSAEDNTAEIVETKANKPDDPRTKPPPAARPRPRNRPRNRNRPPPSDDDSLVGRLNRLLYSRQAARKGRSATSARPAGPVSTVSRQASAPPPPISPPSLSSPPSPRPPSSPPSPAQVRQASPLSTVSQSHRSLKTMPESAATGNRASRYARNRASRAKAQASEDLALPKPVKSSSKRSKRLRRAASGERLLGNRLPVEDEEDDQDVISNFLEGGWFTSDIGPFAWTKEDSMQLVNTEVFPYYPGNPKFDNRQFWLVSAIIDCADYNRTAAMLESGAIQYAVATSSDDMTHEVRALLLVLLRLAASCHSHAHLLIGIQSKVLHILHDCLKTSRARVALLDVLLLWNSVSDSRAYAAYLPVAYGAHTRPVGVDYQRMTPFERTIYENHVKLVWSGPRTWFDDPRNYHVKLPQHLAQYHDTFYMSDLAAEIFLDLAPHGFFPLFVARHMDVKWLRCFDLYLDKAPFNIVTMKLYHLLHQAPVKIAMHLHFPFSIYEECYQTLSWGLNAIIEREFFEDDDAPVAPLDFCITCAETLQTFLAFPAVAASLAFREVRQFMKSVQVTDELLKFLVTVPRIVEDKGDHKLVLLYQAVWNLLTAASYTFPMMFGTLLEFVQDKYGPFCLRANAARYIATMTSFARIPIKRSDMKIVYELLFAELEQSFPEHKLARRRRQDLVFRVAVMLCPRYFGVDQIRGNPYPATFNDKNDPVDKSNLVTAASIFQPYDFFPEAQDYGPF